MDKKIIDELNQQNWRQIRKILVGYVLLKLKYNNVSTKTVEVFDFVDDAIAKTFLGERKWDPARVSLVKFLKKTIDSDVSNFFKKKSTALSSSYDLYDENVTDIVPDTSLNLEDKLIIEEDKKEKLKTIREKLIDDVEAGIVFEYLQEGYLYEEIRQELGGDSNQLNNILKRLKRKILN